MKFVLRINLKCNLIPAKALGSGYHFDGAVCDAFEPPLLLVNWVLKHGVPAGSQLVTRESGVL